MGRRRHHTMLYRNSLTLDTSLIFYTSASQMTILLSQYLTCLLLPPSIQYGEAMFPVHDQPCFVTAATFSLRLCRSRNILSSTIKVYSVVSLCQPVPQFCEGDLIIYVCYRRHSGKRHVTANG
jgi:hypothetical protein